MKKSLRMHTSMIALVFLAACNLQPAATLQAASPTPTAPQKPAATPLPIGSVLTISPGEARLGDFITLDNGGDVDTRPVQVGSPAVAAVQSGNGRAIDSPDGNTVPDSYIQFKVDNSALFSGSPTPSIRLDLEYFDQGTDTFLVEYDAQGGGKYGNGKFLATYPVVKTNTLHFKTVSFVLKDIQFADRDNGADFRIADMSDGAETVRRVTITLLPVPHLINVDSCGANPLDEEPDSTAIQGCIGQAVDGDTVTFTSGENSPSYHGYVIDRTLFLELLHAHKYLTFTSTDPGNPALLRASAKLKGFVVKLWARAAMKDNEKEIQYLTLSHLHLDGDRTERTCSGPDGISNGVNDNWGSWVPDECSSAGDPWCNPGTLDLSGNAIANITASDLHITNTECGTAFGMGGSSMTLINNVIETAGDHVHTAGCSLTDPDSDGMGAWSDGITFAGPNNQILGNTIVNASDVGIVFFGGQETVIRGNTVRATSGNYGTFAGIAIHPWITGDVSFGQVTDNTVTSAGDPSCGGIHAGIDLGTHMWGGGCQFNNTGAIGNATCSKSPAPPRGSPCPQNADCQKWAYLPAGTTFLLTDNQVSGSQINYLVEGFDAAGTLIIQNNVSNVPQRSDWAAARTGCDGLTWGALDFAAHDPTLPGWTNLRVHCER